MTEVVTGFVPVEGAQLYYEVAGRGPAVVLLHAGVADSRMWEAQFETFARQFRVLRYDQRGYGRSCTEPVSFSNRDDLLAVLRHVGIERAALIGNSRGGQIALDFALEYPTYVSGLVLVAAGMSGFAFEESEETSKLEPLFAEIERMETEMERLQAAKEWETLADLEVAMWASGPFQPAERAPAALRQQLRTMILDNYRNHTGGAQPRPLNPPAAGRLAEVRVPVLVLAGELDEPATLLMGDGLANGISGAGKIVFPDTAHMISMERPEEFNRLVLEFLGQV
ncbi:MAG: alpha/beta hydrolase [Chloroflexaceae bacterium]|jgi:pimeloyl-ACP methyl ester carboxylesterase|nr:alpha/beta hydrolase [Chloroflexaceae bacterium]